MTAHSGSTDEPDEPLTWHYGDFGDGRMWCDLCDSEVWFIDDGWICLGCHRTKDADDA